MHRFSNSCRETAQAGRRGALMLSIDVRHPDVMDFIKAKRDGTSITGANISVRLSDEFMKAVEDDGDFFLRFPCNSDFFGGSYEDFPYNELVEVGDLKIKRIKAKEYWDEIVKSARNHAEPGLMYWDNVLDNDPAGVYQQYKPIGSNPCFHPDTSVETEHGRIKIKDIKTSMRVYSMNKKGELVMSMASKSFISKKNAETIKITLRSGSSIQVTPEHKLFVQDIGWVEAKYLKLNDKLGHLCRSRRGAKYAGVHLTTSPNGSKDQVMEHRLVYGNDDEKFNIHHKDRNTYNNDINNLDLLLHSDHSRLTAFEDNPQNHQVRCENGRFISGKNSKKGKKVIVDLPENLKTNVKTPNHNRIISIESGETTDVYDIQVENTNCLIANNIIAHNCGEQFLQAYDSCRLMAMNLYSFVNNPFTENAEIDYKKLYEVAYEQQRLSDDLVELEIEYIDRIINKIKSDKEPQNVKQVELDLWLKIQQTAKDGRRTGCGITALGDMLAACGLAYGSDESLKVVSEVMSTKMRAELDCNIDLAIIRGCFKGWSHEIEYPFESEPMDGNNFYRAIRNYFPEQYHRMRKYGRRSISWSTIAPTGSVSILTQTTSGCEPIFQPFYMRRKKINPSEEGVRVDFVDETGDSWQEFPILHEKFKRWINSNFDELGLSGQQDIEVEMSKVDLQKAFEQSPWCGSTANDIPWQKRNEMQSILQLFISNAISSTINLPSTTTEQEVSDIYLDGWKRGLKGQTVYVDGSRSGVLVSEKTNVEEKFEYRDAVRRPKEIKCFAHKSTSKGVTYSVIVGLINNNPYEIFITEGNAQGGGVVKKLKRGQYKFIGDTGDVEVNITSEMTNEQAAITRLASGMLRHGANIKFVVEQFKKCSGDMFDFTGSLSRVLSKYISNGEKSSLSCDNCGGETIFEEGCSKCLDCGSSKCG